MMDDDVQGNDVHVSAVQGNDDQGTDDQVVDETSGTRLKCVACGAAIDPTEWHPVRSRIDAAGDLHIDPYCSVDCRGTDRTA